MGLIKRGVVILSLTAAVAALSSEAAANTGRYMTVSGITSSPIGHVRFCGQHPKDCSIRSRRAPLVKLTRQRWRELVEINDTVNRNIQPVTDYDLYKVAEYWTYPGSKGDCEDYALLKRRYLVDKGWPAGALLITVVREANGNGHAVLTVRTDKGDLVLDNQDPNVRHWYKTPYRFLKRQSATNAAQWRTIVDRRPQKSAALLRRN